MVNSLLLLLLSTTAGVQDPTQPLRAPAVVPAAPTAPGMTHAPQLQLQAIFSGRQGSAIIDGQRYQVGDSVQNYRLVRINADQVLLQGQGKPLTLTLFPSLSSLSNQ
ncbi:MSHA biogenesis protein MshK [Oceanisphaera sp.]|uniref:SctD/MshK family protein n=1 Tax=Oceanisphaera sp. TaxID=1929979 RepID=UPI003A93E06F